jgi:hypothetical protein
MSLSTAPTALLCMPPSDGRNTLRAALMAMNVLPQDILPSRNELGKLAQRLHDSSRTVAFVDLAGMQQAVPHHLALAALLPQAEARKRMTLTRMQHGLWPSDRAWVNELGFADLVAQLDAANMGSESQGVLAWVAQHTGLPAMQQGSLARYFSALQVKPDTSTPRGLIRKATGLTAEALCAELASNVKSLTRVYRLTSYPSCFIGSEAVAWLTKQYAAPPAVAVQLGVALQTLGLLHHVVHEHAFADEAFFYRTAIASDVERLNLATAHRQLSSSQGVEVRDRLYRGKTYPACFVGTEAVDWVCNQFKLQRHHAETLLNRLHAFNLIEHVTREHVVKDGLFFYRFVMM